MACWSASWLRWWAKKTRWAIQNSSEPPGVSWKYLAWKAWKNSPPLAKGQSCCCDTSQGLKKEHKPLFTLFCFSRPKPLFIAHCRPSPVICRGDCAGRFSSQPSIPQTRTAGGCLLWQCGRAFAGEWSQRSLGKQECQGRAYPGRPGGAVVW